MIGPRSEILAYDIVASAYVIVIVIVIVGVALAIWLLAVWCKKRRG